MAKHNDRTRLQHLQSQVSAIQTWMEDQRTRDKKLQDRFDELQASNQARMDLTQRSIDLLIQSQSHTIGGSKSNRGTPGSSNGVSVTSIATVSAVRDISLGFPHFDGNTPVLEWIFKEEKFFNYHSTPDLDRVDIASIHFQKDVIPWFKML